MAGEVKVVAVAAAAVYGVGRLLQAARVKVRLLSLSEAK